jgi:hypothetical protein
MTTNVAGAHVARPSDEIDVLPKLSPYLMAYARDVAALWARMIMATDTTVGRRAATLLAVMTSVGRPNAEPTRHGAQVGHAPGGQVEDVVQDDRADPR